MDGVCLGMQINEPAPSLTKKYYTVLLDTSMRLVLGKSVRIQFSTTPLSPHAIILWARSSCEHPPP